jgi:hypothetical protein
METQQMTGEESLLVIQQMIDTAKKEQKDDGKGWIAWGWLLFVASIFTLINLKLHFVSVFFFWNVLGLLTIVLTRFIFFKKRQKVRTYTADLFEKLNIGFFISIMFIVVAINSGAVTPVAGFALILSLYGFWMLIYGTVLNFRPSIIGAFINWALAFGALFVKTFDWIMVLHAAAVLAGYIIPGHIAYKEFRKADTNKII